jgi:hypothetical protein
MVILIQNEEKQLSKSMRVIIAHNDSNHQAALCSLLF